MSTAITILIVIISAFLLVGLISYICIMIAAYQLKRKTEEWMGNKGMSLLDKGIDTGISKLQNKVEKTIGKKLNKDEYS